MVTIYGSDGTVKIEAPCGSNSTQVKELQGENVLNLSFTLYEHVALEVNDYADFLGERYWLMEQYKPEQASTVEWKYELKLYGVESLLGRFLVLHDTDGADEAVFTLTAPAREHVALIVEGINAGMGQGTKWEAGVVDGGENITIDYEGKYCIDALKEVVEQVGGRAEWWMDGPALNVCRCERDEEVALGYGKGLAGISCDLAENTGFYTRLYPVGSSRNIDPERYGHTRLQLPGGAKHVDVNVEKYGVWHRYEAAAFRDIYPRRTGTVGSVRSGEAKDSEGNPFTIWYFTDTGLDFDPNGYEIGGKVKRVSFQDGELAGQGEEEDGTYYFEVNYDSGTREFELITIWPYESGLQLPNATLCPKPGDRYILWNIRMPDEYYPLAEEEFKEAVDRYNAENGIDAGRYKGPTDHVYIEENGIDLYVGRRVRLESRKYFPETGYRSSRITKITRRLDLPSQMDIEICDATGTGALDSLAGRIEDAEHLIRTVAGRAFPDLIRSWDVKEPTDTNVFTARRSRQEHLSKKEADRAAGHLAFGGGLTSEKDAVFEEDATVKGRLKAQGGGTVTGDLLVEGREEVKGDMKVSGETTLSGNASVGGALSVEGKATARGGLQTGPSFVPGLMGKGGLLDGEGRGELRSLRLWEWLEVPELRYNRVTAYAGIRWDTVGAGTVESVSVGGDGLSGSCTLKLEEGEIGLVSENDLCMGIWHDTSGNAASSSDDRRGNFAFAGFKTVCFQVTSVPDTDGQGRGNADRHYFTYTLRPGTSAHPSSGMGFAARGNTTDTSRQAFAYTTTEYSVLMAGVNQWEFTDAMYVGVTGKLEGFTINGRELHGYGQYFGNAYVYGRIDQFERQADSMRLSDTLGGFMREGETDTLLCSVHDGYGRNVTANYSGWQITRTTTDAASDAAWNAAATAPEVVDTGSGPAARYDIAFADLGAGSHAAFTFSATDAEGSTLSASTAFG